MLLECDFTYPAFIDHHHIVSARNGLVENTLDNTMTCIFNLSARSSVGAVTGQQRVNELCLLEPDLACFYIALRNRWTWHYPNYSSIHCCICLFSVTHDMPRNVCHHTYQGKLIHQYCKVDDHMLAWKAPDSWMLSFPLCMKTSLAPGHPLQILPSSGWVDNHCGRSPLQTCTIAMMINLSWPSPDMTIWVASWYLHASIHPDIGVVFAASTWQAWMYWSWRLQ